MSAEQSPKIVIVDESPIRAAILQEGLREAGFTQVVHISEMQSLLARIYAVDPDIILIDLENPSRDVLEAMFQVSRAVRRPIAMFVDQSDSASIQASVEAGVSAYIVDGLKKERIKPILDLCVSRFNAFAKLQEELERTKSQLEDRKIIERAKGILMHVKSLIAAPFNLGINGNAITVSPALYEALMGEIDGDRYDPMATARALSRVVAKRRKSGAEPLTFGMTFPFSTHNYQLRYWMAAGGVDPDEDVHMVVLPPPYMVDSLANGHVDAFCVGAPWNSVAVDLGVGHILHFVADILVRAVEKVLAVRQDWSEKNPDVVAALVRAAFRAAEFIEQPQNRAEAARILAQPERIGVDADVIQRTLDGHLKISPDGTMRESSRYLLVGREGAARPDPVQAAWLYAQMVRWGQASISPEALKTAMGVFRPDLYEAALGLNGKAHSGAP